MVGPYFLLMATAQSGGIPRDPSFCFTLVATTGPKWEFMIIGNSLEQILEEQGIKIIDGDLFAGAPALVWVQVSQESTSQFMMLPSSWADILD